MARLNGGGGVRLTKLQAIKLVLYSHNKMQFGIPYTKEIASFRVAQIAAHHDAELLWTGAKLSYSIGGFLVYGYNYNYADVTPIVDFINKRK